MKLKYFRSIIIAFLFLVGFKNIWRSLPFRYVDLSDEFFSTTFDYTVFVTHHFLSFLVGLIMILLAYNLYKRIQFAWLIETIALSISILIMLYHFSTPKLPYLLIESTILIYLLLNKKEFPRKSEKGTLRKSFSYIVVALIILLINTSLGLFILRGHIQGIKTIFDAMSQSIRLFMFMDTSLFDFKTQIGEFYLKSILMIYWCSIFISLIILMKPLVYKPILHQHLKKKAIPIVDQFGLNPMSYLALEDDKLYFFSKSVEGVCAYTLSNDIMVICGDLICKIEDQDAMCRELMAFAKNNYYSIVFLNTTDTFLELYQKNGFGITKYGEDAVFDLNAYNLKGGRVAKVRAAINHARKADIKIYEYKPNDTRDLEVEAQINEISKEWLSQKNMPEMKFMLGSNNLETPLKRRYFYAKNQLGEMLGYVVFNPYENGRSVIAEVTRRKSHAPQGVLETIIYDAFMQMKDEGLLTGNLGLSPLYNISAEEKLKWNDYLFQYVYEHLDQIYGFKALHHAKEKYAPTAWENRYIAFYPKPFLPQYAYAIVNAQLPDRLSKIILKLVWDELRTKGGRYVSKYTRKR